MVSYTFKRRRFETLHANAIRWPPAQFEYLGVNPLRETEFDLEGSTRGELENSYGSFEEDPYGCHTEGLLRKRRERNPFSRRAPYELTCPEMGELLAWCGPELIAEARVPWGK